MREIKKEIIYYECEKCDGKHVSIVREEIERCEKQPKCEHVYIYM